MMVSQDLSLKETITTFDLSVKKLVYIKIFGYYLTN